MPMKNPPHRGSVVLSECIEPLGLTITQAAQALGVTRATFFELVNGKRGIPPEMAIRLSQVFGGSAQSWVTQQAQYDLAKIPESSLDTPNTYGSRYLKAMHVPESSNDWPPVGLKVSMNLRVER
jgi:addiction module HigA family antidote